MSNAADVMGIVGTIVGAVGILVAIVPREQLLRLVKRRSTETIEPDISMFGPDSVEIVTHELVSSNQADAVHRKEYYEGAPLDWSIIAADADIRRDQQAGLVEQLCHCSTSLRFFCILGESGSGKSTLARRLAAELHEHHKAVVIRVRKNSEDTTAPDVWYHMEAFCAKVGRPVYVLADDPFRKLEVCRALEELSPSVPLTVLATSRTNEFHPGRLKGQQVVITLGAPTDEEKDRVIHRVQQSGWRPNGQQLTRVAAANEFLVLMAELTSGKKFHEIVEDTLDGLLRQYEPVYRAYEYLCFAYSYDVALPTQILERLDTDGRFQDLPKQQGSKGLIFYDENNATLVRPGHPRRAEMTRTVYEDKHRPSAMVLRELAVVVDASAWLDRKFLAVLLLSLAIKGGLDVLEKALPHIESRVAECIRRASRIDELVIWRSFYLKLDRRDEADACTNAALRIEPVTSVECTLLRFLFCEVGRERDALPILDRLVRNRPDWAAVGDAYVALVERYGTRPDQHRAIDETSVWLAAHPDDHHVWARFLGLVERKGTPEQIARVLQDTLAWLAAHPDDSTARTRFLGLVERKGTPEQIARVLQDTLAWLAAHPDDSTVRTCFLGLVERKGTPEQIARVLQDTLGWLAAHPDDHHVWARFLGLVERKGTPEQIARVLQDTLAWLAAHADDDVVRGSFLGLVERKGTPEQIARVLQDTLAWLPAHPGALNTWEWSILHTRSFGKLDDARVLAEKAAGLNPTNAHIARLFLTLAGDQLDEATVRDRYDFHMRTFPLDMEAKRDWARWLHKHKYWKEAEEILVKVMAEYPTRFEYNYEYGRLLLDVDRYEEAAVQFRRVLLAHRAHAMGHDGLASALQGLVHRAEEESSRSPEAARLSAEAEHEFGVAIYWSRVLGNGEGILFAHLGWFYNDSKRWREAIDAFDRATKEDPERFENYWGKGCALAGLERWNDALSALLMAKERAPEPLKPPASDEIQRLIQQCEAALHSGCHSS